MSVDVFSRDFPVKFSHIDRAGLLSPTAALDYFEEAAFCHAELLGVGYEAMMSRRQAWVLSRITVHIERRPRLHDTITVSTWPRGHDRLFAVRDYEIALHGQVLVRGRSNWIIFDLDKRRPVRPQDIMDKLPLNEGKDALTESPAVLGEAQGLAPATIRKAHYSDLDFNGHVHNTRYMQWICDLFKPEKIENAPSVRFDINYLKEIPASSSTGILLGETDGVYHIEGRRIDGRKESGPVFRARIAF
jgi:acyl-ACP thioesterase